MLRISSILLFTALLLIAVSFPSKLIAQKDIQKEVRVVKPYSPTLSEANKINLLPEFNDTSRVIPGFSYSIFPKRFDTDYKIDPIKPAKMVGMPISRLYKSQLTLGAGNYLTPYMELTINQLRSKSTQLGFYFNHQSSSGKVKLDNNKKVNAGYSDNLVKLYGKKIFNSSVLESDITGGYNSVLYYGYNTAFDTILESKKNIQKIYTAGAALKFYSIHSDSFHLNYKTGLNYGIVNDFFKNTEHSVDISSSLNKRVRDQVLGGDARIRYFNRTGSNDSAEYIVLDINPWYAKSTNEWKFLLGLNTTYDQSKSILNLYPHGTFEFNIVPRVLIPYMGLSGYEEINDYKKILFENPYISPGTTIRNTNHSMIAFAGIKGRYSKNMAYNIKVVYEKIDSLYFYINDTTELLRNKFIAVYDNATLLNLGGELSWHQSEKLQLFLKANYYRYQLEKLEQAWHRPSFEASVSADYNLRDKIMLGTNIFYTGKRFASEPGGISTELKGYIDANLALEYRYTKTLSFFLRINNLTASKYQVWNQYPSQRLQFLAGFSYAL